MIENTIARNDQTVKRLALRSSQETFANVIAAGTSCSKFEAAVISGKALEIFNLGPYGDDSSFLPGQMSWRAIDAAEPPGKPLRDCKYHTIRPDGSCIGRRSRCPSFLWAQRKAWTADIAHV